MVYYSVAKGRTIGIFESWSECKKSIDGFEGAVFKKFDTKEDAEKFSKTGFSKSNTSYLSKSNTSSIAKSNISSTAKSNNDIERYQNVNFDSDSESESDKKVINTISKKIISNKTLTRSAKEEANIRSNINFDSDSDTDSEKNSKKITKQVNIKSDIIQSEKKIDKLDKLILSHNKTLKIEDYNDSDDNEENDINEIFKSSNLICKIEDLKSFKPDTIVYTDGSCINNGYPNAEAGIGIYFGLNDSRNVSKKIENSKKSNNIAELTALITAYKILESDIKNNKKIVIFSDSIYAIRCISIYGEKNEKLKWNNSIPNVELVKEGYELFKNKSNIKIIWIKAHTELSDIHSLGNQEADRLANLSINPDNKTTLVKDDNKTTFIKNNKVSLVKDDTVNSDNKITISKEKIYLDVPFAKKDEAKKLGCRWDPDKKKWYILDNSNDNIFKQFKKI